MFAMLEFEKGSVRNCVRPCLVISVIPSLPDEWPTGL